MARTGKKKELTTEEKLQRALVPEEEQPYKVPNNWCWVYAPYVYRIEYGKGLSTKELTEEGYPVFGANGLIGYYREYIYEDPQALMSCRGAYSGTMNISLPNSFVTSNSLVIHNMLYEEQPEYTRYLLESQDTSALVSGSAQPQVTVQAFKNYPLPIIPIQEQQRIVDRIESLFAKLEEAQEKAQAVVDGFEDRKAAILHKAFTGELTEKWREENNIPKETWSVVCLNDVCKSIFDGDHMPPPKSDSGVPFLVISNVNNGHLSFENTRFVPTDYYESLTDTRKPEVNDVLYTLVGSYGIPVIVDDEREFCFQRHMALLKPEKVNTYFLWYQLQTQEFFNKATEIATGTAQMTVPIKGLRKLTIHLPSEEEQKKIVDLLETLIQKEELAKSVAENVTNQIDMMKKAILSRAFRGELGTNDPSEESATKLLKQILQEN